MTEVDWATVVPARFEWKGVWFDKTENRITGALCYRSDEQLALHHSPVVERSEDHRIWTALMPLPAYGTAVGKSTLKEGPLKALGRMLEDCKSELIIRLRSTEEELRWLKKLTEK